FGGIYHMPDGDKPIYYNGMIDCIMEPGKHCNCCQRCLQLEKIHEEQQKIDRLDYLIRRKEREKDEERRTETDKRVG
ncbi:MAG: hypothetical protein II042_02830, partial [Erysipelotrichaceae bacterium]|nr:hypothetical protein [Erysipelotrichaceae bacterium]